MMAVNEGKLKYVRPEIGTQCVISKILVCIINNMGNRGSPGSIFD